MHRPDAMIALGRGRSDIDVKTTIVAPANNNSDARGNRIENRHA
jgi:hypothetical protein